MASDTRKPLGWQVQVVQPNPPPPPPRKMNRESAWREEMTKPKQNSKNTSSGKVSLHKYEIRVIWGLIQKQNQFLGGKGGVSQYRYRHTGIGNPITKIKRFYDRLTFTDEILYLEGWSLCWDRTQPASDTRYVSGETVNTCRVEFV